MLVLCPQTGSADPTGDGVADCGVKVIVILSPGSAALFGLGFSQVSQVSGVYLISPWKVLPLISPSAISMQSAAARLAAEKGGPLNRAMVGKMQLLPFYLATCLSSKI